jgi:hypothetical protein
MAVPVSAVVDEAIRYEQSLAALYQAFSSLFEEDSELWSEGEHAMILESSRTLFKDEFSSETVPADLDALRESNDSLESALDRFEKNSPSRKEAFLLALEFEGDQNERTIHRLLKIAPSQPASKVVDRIRNDDSIHQVKIRKYAESKGLEL